MKAAVSPASISSMAICWVNEWMIKEQVSEVSRSVSYYSQTSSTWSEIQWRQMHRRELATYESLVKRDNDVFFKNYIGSPHDNAILTWLHSHKLSWVSEKRKCKGRAQSRVCPQGVPTGCMKHVWTMAASCVNSENKGWGQRQKFKFLWY